MQPRRFQPRSKSGDRKLAERIAHTVKGVAGNLGITEVQSAAQKLEKAIREGQDTVSALLDEFAGLMDTQVHAIEQALRESAPAQSEEAQPSPFDRRSGSRRDCAAPGPCLRPVTVMPKRRFAVCRMQWRALSRNRNWML